MPRGKGEEGERFVNLDDHSSDEEIQAQKVEISVRDDDENYDKREESSEEGSEGEEEDDDDEEEEESSEAPTVEIPSMMDVVPLDDSENQKQKKGYGSFDLRASVSETENFRRIHSNNYEEGKNRNLMKKYAKNSVSTTKYTWWNFIPKNLYEQFHRLANFFFLACAVLTLVPGITNITPVSSISPLVFVLGVTALKEAYDDVKRAQGDSEVNNTKVLILRNGEWQSLKWKDVEVGDVVKIAGNESFPGDLLLLSSSLSNGMCYIQTANLDGETNLKVRQALPETNSLKTTKQLSAWRGIIECENPNKDLYNFDGRLFVPSKKNSLSLSITQLLLRGCVLKNTEFVIGVAVFTGKDTKLRQNSRDPPTKRSALEKEMNSALKSLFILLFVFCVFCSIGGVINFMDDDHWYLRYGKHSSRDAFVEFLKNIASYAILYSYMIPISLYVCMEVVKLFQTFLLENDINMYHEETDTPAKAKTSNLNEELGQIDFVFSDKTGTLTSNEMELVKCTIEGTIFVVGENYAAEQQQQMNEGGKPAVNSNSTKHQFQSVTGNFEIEEFTREVLVNQIQSQENSTAIDFFNLLAVCHSVLPESNPKDPSQLEYQASSPDELALVQKAANMGFVFKKRTFDTVVVEVKGNLEEYKILNMIDFTSSRKRMSVICRTPNGKIRLYCKGADSVIAPRLTADEAIRFKEITNNQLEYFAAEGLRTLCCAYADLDERTYAAWNEQYERAASSIQDRKGKIEEAAEAIEQNLKILGCTAIEDKLQVGVPEAIHQLRRALIKIWVLTGDKQETAINIGLSCRLLTGINLITLYQDQPDAVINFNTVREQLERALAQIEETKGKGEEYGLVIEGECLKFCLDKTDQGLQPTFMKLALQCKTVICCRVSPSQKRGVVRAVKKTLPFARTLAIGDGANDVSMIQEAHIGVGILGKEGRQAAMNSDYCIAQFRYLANLLLIHGRQSYIRTSKLVLYSFYKNAVLSACLFLFVCSSLFSAQNMFDSISLAGYNVAFAAFPIVLFAVLDQDVKGEQVFIHPKLYETGQKNEQFSTKLVWLWFLYGIIHAVFIFIGTVWWFDFGIVMDDGSTYDLWSFGIAGFTALVLVVNLKVAVDTTYWTWINWVAILGTILFWFLYSIIFTAIPSVSGQEYYVTQHLWQAPSFWFYLVIIVFACLIPDITWKYIARNYMPSTREIVQEIQKEGRDERKRLRLRGFVVRKPTVMLLPLDKLSGSMGDSHAKAHKGYAFAQDDKTSAFFSDSLGSLLKKKIQSRKKKKEARKAKRKQAEKNSVILIT